MKVNSDRSGQLSVTCICCASFHTDTNHPLDLCGSVDRDSSVTVTVAHLRDSLYGSLVSDSDISLFKAQGRCGLTGQSMAQQSFGAFGPVKVWDLSGVSERGTEVERKREVLRDSKCTFSFAVPSGEENERANNNRR